MPDLLITDLKEFLLQKSKELLKEKSCKDCGSDLSAVSLKFWLYGEDQAWDVPFQFCLRCHPELTALNLAAAA